MLGPLPNYSLFCTLGHEYGFSEDNLSSLLTICGFEDIEILNFPPYHQTLIQKLANILRKLFTFKNVLNHRLFNGDYRKAMGIELVMSGTKKDKPELFDIKFK
jgi:hypothetical protein